MQLASIWKRDPLCHVLLEGHVGKPVPGPALLGEEALSQQLAHDKVERGLIEIMQTSQRIEEEARSDEGCVLKHLPLDPSGLAIFFIQVLALLQLELAKIRAIGNRLRARVDDKDAALKKAPQQVEHSRDIPLAQAIEIGRKIGPSQVAPEQGLQITLDLVAGKRPEIELLENLLERGQQRLDRIVLADLLGLDAGDDRDLQALHLRGQVRQQLPGQGRGPAKLENPQDGRLRVPLEAGLELFNHLAQGRAGSGDLRAELLVEQGKTLDPRAIEFQEPQPALGVGRASGRPLLPQQKLADQAALAGPGLSLDDDEETVASRLHPVEIVLEKTLLGRPRKIRRVIENRLGGALLLANPLLNLTPESGIGCFWLHRGLHRWNLLRLELEYPVSLRGSAFI